MDSHFLQENYIIFRNQIFLLSFFSHINQIAIVFFLKKILENAIQTQNAFSINLAIVVRQMQPIPAQLFPRCLSVSPNYFGPTHVAPTWFPPSILFMGVQTSTKPKSQSIQFGIKSKFDKIEIYPAIIFNKTV